MPLSFSNSLQVPIWLGHYLFLRLACKGLSCPSDVQVQPSRLWALEIINPLCPCSIKSRITFLFSLILASILTHLFAWLRIQASMSIDDSLAVNSLVCLFMPWFTPVNKLLQPVSRWAHSLSKSFLFLECLSFPPSCHVRPLLFYTYRLKVLANYYMWKSFRSTSIAAIHVGIPILLGFMVSATPWGILSATLFRLFLILVE